MGPLTAAPTQQVTLIRNDRPVVYHIHDAQIVLRRRRRGGAWTKYLVGYLNDVRFEARCGLATNTEVRQIRARYN